MSFSTFQKRTYKWLNACFSKEICTSVDERNQRFIEEAIELVQSTGLTEAQVIAAVEYVYARPIGEPKQEIGGTIVTLVVLCEALNLNLESCAETELKRVWDKMPQIRAKQKLKPRFGSSVTGITKSIHQSLTNCVANGYPAHSKTPEEQVAEIYEFSDINGGYYGPDNPVDKQEAIEAVISWREANPSLKG
jgi:hypothetical protein